MTPRLFKFTNVRGLTVKGILYPATTKPGSPAAAGHDTGVVYLPGIVLGATATHRLGIDLAHQLARDGYPVCLFDPAGIGESEGDYPAGTHQELASWIEAGSCVGDTLQTIDYLLEHAGVRQLVLIGHCGGALTAMYAAARHAAVVGVLLICPPTVCQGEKEALDGPAEAAPPPPAPVAEPPSSSWLDRAIRGVRRPIDAMLGRGHAGEAPSRRATAAEKAFNRRLIEAVQIARADGKRVEIVVGDRDPDVDAFRTFQRIYLPEGVGTRVLDGTSHGFVTATSVALLFSEVGEFMATIGSALF